MASVVETDQRTEPLDCEMGKIDQIHRSHNEITTMIELSTTQDLMVVV